jgi:uncharacterized protein (TIGR02757 family)
MVVDAAQIRPVPSRAADCAWLEALRRRYHRRRFVHPDPLEFLYRCPDLDDREVVAVIASSLAYGNVKAMLAAIENVLGELGSSPAGTLRSISRRTLARRLRGFRYRFTSDQQIVGLLSAVTDVMRAHGSIERSILQRDDRSDETILPALARFVDELRLASPCSLAHLVPNPSDGSACKRLNLMLRWMVRRDAVDPGGWTTIDPARLVMPLDTHVFQVAHRRGWTQRKSADLRTAMEITDALRAIAPDDPLRYDFAITRPGIRRELDALVAHGT